MPSAGTWESRFQASFRRANATPASFAPLIASHNVLLKANRALSVQCASAEKQLIILTHEAEQAAKEGGGAAGSPSHSGMVQQVQATMQEKISSLQEELTAQYKSSAEAAETKLKLNEAEKALDSCQAQLTESEKGYEVLAEENEKLTTSNGLLQKELDSVRGLLAKKEEECTALRAENDAFVMRMLEDKAAMVAEMNKMNDLIVQMKAQLAAYEQEAKAGEGKGGEGGVAAAAAAEGGEGAGGIGGLSDRTWSVAVTMPTQIRHTVKGHHTEVNALCYHSCQPVLFSASSDGSVKMWDTASGRAKSTLRGGQPIIDVDVFDNLVAGASTDRSVRLWDMRTERIKFHGTGHSNKVHAVRFSPDGRYMVTGSTDRTLKLWDVVSGREVRTLRSSSTCNAVDFSGEGTTVVSGHQDGSVRLWDIGTGSKIDEAKPHGNQVTSCRFSPRGGMQILTVSRDNKLKLLDARTLDAISTLSHESLRISQNWSRANFSPDGQFVVAGSATGTVHVWETATGRCRQNLSQHSAAVSSCAWAPGTGGWQQVASCDKNGYINMWD